jgi:hypothetical protein
MAAITEQHNRLYHVGLGGRTARLPKTWHGQPVTDMFGSEANHGLGVPSEDNEVMACRPRENIRIRNAAQTNILSSGNGDVRARTRKAAKDVDAEVLIRKKR